jgi:outer membrane immunogenic protein
MKKILLTLSSIFCLTTNVNAQSYAGFYGQIGLGYEGVVPNYSGSVNGLLGGLIPVTSATTTTTSNANSALGMISAGYMTELHRDLLLGIGADFSPLAGQKANYTTKTSILGTYSGQYQKQNSYNIFLSPATPLGKGELLYAKLGYSSISMEDTLNQQSQNSRYNGYLFGLGYKQLITGGLYGYGEINYTKYGNQTTRRSVTATTIITQTTNLNAYNLVAGIGYKF